MDPITLGIIAAIAVAVTVSNNEKEKDIANSAFEAFHHTHNHHQTEITKRFFGILLIVFALAGLAYGAMTGENQLPVYLLSVLVGSGGIATLLSQS